MGEASCSHIFGMDLLRINMRRIKFCEFVSVNTAFFLHRAAFVQSLLSGVAAACMHPPVSGRRLTRRLRGSHTHAALQGGGGGGIENMCGSSHQWCQTLNIRNWQWPQV
ncbi:hypothetical protein IF1G_10513 [Cordyceps javanica]|uniref:Uncharacterized protein n=1 Tax=Cordyceps javanica TaxID=43265 RepID=A0A545UMU5_9HYPO|nr:hypothetical protein IF1G_10513 [Cordyceps javanica]